MNAYIVGCAKNCAAYVVPVFENISKMAAFFDNVRVVISLGQSEDDTLNALNHMRAKYPNLSITMLYNPNNEISPIRTERIAMNRNSLMQYIRDTAVSQPAIKWTHMIMLDMDNVCSAPMDTEVFRQTLREDDEWDAVSFNAPVYYDIWALSYKPFTVSCWNWGPDSRNVVNFMIEDIQARLLSHNEKYYACDSAFNGLAIYKLDKFLDCSYDHRTKPFEQLDRDDVEYSVGFFRHVFQNPQVNIYYLNAYEDCEHRAFHEEARIKNGARIRISPKILFPQMSGV